MLDFYYWPTPNGWKVGIMLEECGLEYRVRPINIGRGDQFEDAFLKISPNNRMPAIVDSEGPEGPISVFESGAILCYLADKTGRFMPAAGNARYDVLQWLFWQMGGLGPMAGQLSHFVNYAPEKNPYALDRYGKEYNRLLGVMERALQRSSYLAGDYSIADMASFPWVVPHERFEQPLDPFPRLKVWFETVRARPAVERAMALGAELRSQGKMDDEARKILFGQTASSVDELASRS